MPPGSAGDGQRQSAAQCEGCQWRMTGICTVDNRPPTSPDEAGCIPRPAWCTLGRDRVRLWHRGPSTSGAWQVHSMFCRPVERPITVGDATQIVRSRFVASLSPPRLRHQPPTVALVSIPVHFSDTGPSAPVRQRYRLAGQDVDLSADPRWTWQFGDGNAVTTGQPSRPWPAAGVRHTYRRPGQHSVSVQVAWPASFTVSGLGPFPIDELVRTDASAVVQVAEARAVLVARR